MRCEEGERSETCWAGPGLGKPVVDVGNPGPRTRPDLGVETWSRRTTETVGERWCKSQDGVGCGWGSWCYDG